MTLLHRQKITTFLEGLQNKIFNITWIKKDESIRNANVRRKVTRYLKGGNGPKQSNAFIAVYLMPQMAGNTFLYESGYRMLNLETIKQININGDCFEITPEPIINSIDLSLTTKPQRDNLIKIA